MTLEIIEYSVVYLIPTELSCLEYQLSVVATTRRFPSDSGAFADWSAAASAVGRGDDLSLGFNASSAVTSSGAGIMWPAASRSFTYNHHHDIFLMTPASSFHNDAVLSDPNNGSNNPTTALGVNVFPLLTAAPCFTASQSSESLMENINNNNNRNTIQLWQVQESPPQQHHHHHGAPDDNVMMGRNRIQLWHEHDSPPPPSHKGDTCGDGGLGVGTCQDCGNQAKKDCSHRRCRTCCKSRGFDCATHVKSTWVPAARRRERQLMAVSMPGVGSTVATSGGKKPRLGVSQTTTTSHTSTSNNTTPPRSFDTDSSHQDVGFKESLPCQVRAPAVFKCVRVTAMEDGEDEYAYQAVVKIGGHVFKGFLYDQGVEDKEDCPNLSELHLGGGGNVASGNDHGGRNGVSSSSPMVDPSHVYGGGGLLGGSSNYDRWFTEEPHHVKRIFIGHNISLMSKQPAMFLCSSRHDVLSFSLLFLSAIQTIANAQPLISSNIIGVELTVPIVVSLSHSFNY
ncbi:hypothetical protein VNO78_12230 [Psophocarpus tetragonolobus]|uniref:Uncharacterized protein n=1 Tax=Psophocarpus tetragonolobus TaxID=3891 RepID=A0AAN9SNK2_PSOTE